MGCKEEKGKEEAREAERGAGEERDTEEGYICKETERVRTSDHNNSSSRQIVERQEGRDGRGPLRDARRIKRHASSFFNHSSSVALP